VVLQQYIKSTPVAFFARVKEVGDALNVPASWLMIVMFFESSLNHKAVNPTTGASGLIQFMPATARELGTTVEAIRQMTNVQQMELVQRYLKRYASRIHTFADLYCAIFYPALLYKPASYIVGSERGPSYQAAVARQNAIFDLNKDGKISKAEFHQSIVSRASKYITVAELLTKKK
jgi:hypothetical protein